MAKANLVSQLSLTGPIVDNNGNPTREFAIWIRDIYNRTSYKGGNAIDQNKEELDQELLSTNSSLSTTIETVNQNIINIETNENATETNATNLSNHEALNEAHGSNGVIVGKDDLATEVLVGLVKQMGLIADAIASTVDVTSADIAAAPATYDQTYTDTVKDLANETKADLNTLVTDVNNAITKINAILAETITSGQMNNV